MALKLAITAVVLFTLAACASGGIHEAGQRPNIPKESTASLIIESNVRASPAIKAKLRQALQSALLDRGVFKAVRVDGPGSEYSVIAEILTVEEVSQGARSFWGGFAGQASIGVYVTVKNNLSGAIVGTFSARAQSSGASVTSGTTDDAIYDVADRIAAYLAGQGS